MVNQNKTDGSRILTTQEVAELFRIHRSTVSRLAKSGEIKSYKVGNRTLFKESDVWLFFENQVVVEKDAGKD